MPSSPTRGLATGDGDPEGGSIAPPRPAQPRLDPSRPFGTHIRMAWWRSIVVIVAVPLVLVVSQLGMYLLAGLVEGGDPFAQTLTPVKMLAANLSTGLTALVAVALVARFAGVPWRSVLSVGRGFDRRRLVAYLLAAVVLVALSTVAVGLIDPGATGWTGFGISGTTVALLVVIVLTTPIQAAGEELMFRGAMLPAAASWFRAVKPALIAGLIVSSVAFMAVHGTMDPPLVAYLLFFSLCTALMGVISRGLEAAIAFHVANNVIGNLVNAVLVDGGPIVIDRAQGAGGGTALLIPAALNVAVLAVVWLRERSRPRR